VGTCKQSGAPSQSQGSIWLVERVGPQVSLCPPGQNSGISNTCVPGTGFLDLIQRDPTHSCVRSWSADKRSSRICVCPAQKSSSRVVMRQAGPSIPGSRCAFGPDSIGVSRPRSWHRITAGRDSRGDELQAPSNRVPHRPTAPYPHSARVLGG